MVHGNRGRFGAVLAVLGITAVFGVGAWAVDSPQWNGINRDTVSPETGLLKQWPEGGPKLLWKVSGRGENHATVSVAKGRVYGMGLKDGQEYVWAVEAATGKEVWTTPIAKGIQLDAGQGGYGPRGTPTIDGSKLYALGVEGTLVCLNVADGKEMWKQNLVKDYGGKVPTWGYSESPLVDGEKVIVTPGNGEATLVAFAKSTGSVLWKAKVPEGDPAHYASAVTATIGGVKQYVQFLSGGVVGIRATDGKFLWRYNRPANHVANCASPIVRGDKVFAASAYGTGGGMALVKKEGEKFDATEVYFTKEMMNHHGGVVLVGNYLYGFNDTARGLTCLEFETGKVMWSNKELKKGSVMVADGMIYARSESGPIALVEANPKEYVEHGKFDQPDASDKPKWAHPVIANGHLYISDQGNLFCYDIKGK